MSTHAAIRYEAEAGPNPGVYLHFDGYPENVAPQLVSMSYIQVKEGIERALEGGGLRSLADGDFSDTLNVGGEGYAGTIPEDAVYEFNYIKRLDDSVECVDSHGSPVCLTGLSPIHQ